MSDLPPERTPPSSVAQMYSSRSPLHEASHSANPIVLRQVLVEHLEANKIRARPGVTGSPPTFREMPNSPHPQFIPSQFKTPQYTAPQFTAPQFHMQFANTEGESQATRLGGNYESRRLSFMPTRIAAENNLSGRETAQVHPIAVSESEWGSPRVRADEVFLEEIGEDDEEEQRKRKITFDFDMGNTRNLIQPVSENIYEAVTTVRDVAWDAREQFLDWIWKGGYVAPTVPPCPPLPVLCKCIQPARIRPIDNYYCECGKPTLRCDDCCGLLPICPYCGRRLPPRSRCGIDCASPCLIECCPKKPQPLPELVVTSMGPFRDKRYVEERPPCSRCVAGTGLSDMCLNVAFDFGQFIGSQLSCCQKEPPPMPVPGRPIQRLLPFFFPPAPPRRQSKFPFNLLKRREPVYMPPKGGMPGCIEDCASLGIGATALTLDVVAECLNQSACCAELLPGSMHCYCDSPPLRYPKNGIYGDPPIAPTKATGWRALDAFNNFMDACTFPPSKPEDVELIKEGDIPETEETGNVVVDKVNALLDRLLPPLQPIEPSSPYAHDPLQALLTYLTACPKTPVPEEYIFPCLAPDKNGLNCIERNLPGICLGEGLAFTAPRCGPEQVDYINFTLVPSNVAEVPHQSQGERTVMPIVSQL